MAQQFGQQPYGRHRARDRMAARAFQKFGVAIFIRHVERFSPNSSFRHEAAELPAPLQQILGFAALERWPIKWRLDDFFVWQWDVKASSKLAQLTFVQLFLLVCDIAPFTCLAQAVTFNRFGQYHCRRALVLNGTFVSRKNFCGIMATSKQFADLVVGHVVDHFQKLWVFTEKMLPGITSRLDRIFLVISVDRFLHALQ